MILNDFLSFLFSYLVVNCFGLRLTAIPNRPFWYRHNFLSFFLFYLHTHLLVPPLFGGSGAIQKLLYHIKILGSHRSIQCKMGQSDTKLYTDWPFYGFYFVFCASTGAMILTYDTPASSPSNTIYFGFCFPK